jgi:hypothetical protein
LTWLPRKHDRQNWAASAQSPPHRVPLDFAIIGAFLQDGPSAQISVQLLLNRYKEKDKSLAIAIDRLVAPCQ